MGARALPRSGPGAARPLIRRGLSAGLLLLALWPLGAQESPLWRLAVGGTLIAPPAARAGSAVIVLDSGSLKAFSTQGKPLWDYFSRGRLSPFLTRSPEGHCYIARTNGTFIAVNRLGRELWRADLRAPLSGPPVCGWDGRLFVPAGDSVICLTAAGRQLWRRNLGSPMIIPPVPDPDGGIVTALAGGMLLRLGPFGEAQTLYLSAGPRAIAPLGFPGAGGRVLIAYPNGGMELADFRSADFNRGPQPLPRLEGRPLAAAGWGLKAALFLDTGQILGLDGLTGEGLWSARTGIRAGEGQPALIYDERGICLLSRSAAAGFSGEGEALWTLDLEGTSVLPGLGDDGVVYSGGTDWILSAFKPDDRVLRLPQPLSPPEGNYGCGAPPPSSWTGNPMRWEEFVLEEQLRIIRGEMIQGRTGDREIEYAAFLMEIINAGLDPESIRPRPRVHISHRVQSLRLLGLIGSRDTIPFLVRIFTEEREPAVRAAAASAIGLIGQDNGGAAIRAFYNTVSRGNLPEDQVLLALASAAGALSRFSGPPLSGEGIGVLSALNSPLCSNMVRSLARRELESLYK